MRIPSGVTDQYIYFVAVDATDLKTRETGLTTFTVYRSRNGGAAAAMTTPTINEVDATNMPGVYELLLDEDMTIDAGDDSQEMVFHITATGMAPVTRTIELYRPKITAGNTAAVDSSGRVDLGLWLGVAPLALNSQRVQARIGSIATGIIAAGSFAAGALDAAALATDAVNEIVAAVWAATTRTLTANTNFNDPTAAAIADAVWDELISGHIGAGSFGEEVQAHALSSEITALNDLSQADIRTAVGLASANLDTQLAAIPTASEINAEVVDALATDTYAEPGQGTPAATASLATKINYLYKNWRNRKTQTSTTFSLFNDDAVTVDQKATVSDNGTTAEKTEIATGP